MKTSLTFSEHEIVFLKSMIGKQFNKFKRDPFVYSPMIYGIAGFYLDEIITIK